MSQNIHKMLLTLDHERKSPHREKAEIYFELTFNLSCLKVMLWKNIELHLYANANKCGKSYQQRPQSFCDGEYFQEKPWERVI